MYARSPVASSALHQPFALRYLLLATMALLLSLPPAATPARLSLSHTAHPPVTTTAFGKLPLAFVPNAGQVDPAVRFQARALGGTLFFTDQAIVLALPTRDQPAATLRLRFAGANPTPELVAEERQPGIANYLIGADPARWRTHLPMYARITYRQLYPGIDLRYDGADGRLKGTYAVAPGANPTRIRWRYDGPTHVRVEARTGDLLMTMGGTSATLTERAPVAWQVVDGGQVPVAARYQINADGSIEFVLGHYDPTLPLTIDPTLEYSTYLGGSNDDSGHALAVDSAGSAYIAGFTSSPNFPTTAPSTSSSYGNAFVTKLSPDGQTLVYSTILGGGSSGGIAVDGNGNAYITGLTGSPDFPTINAFDSSLDGTCIDEEGPPFPCNDAFVAKLSPDGSTLLYSTFLGGSNHDGGADIAVDSTGSASITGATISSDFPVANAFQPSLGGGICDDIEDGDEPCPDAFVAKLGPAGNALVYSSYLGGSRPDLGYGIAVDSAGNASITGETFSTDFPLLYPLDGTPDLYYGEAFVTKFSATGSPAYSTYLGGSSSDTGEGIAADSAGNAYVTGNTSSTDFPTNAAFDNQLGGLDAFVAKLNPSGSALIYGTYLGGGAHDYGKDIAVDSSGSAYVAGNTESTDFPLAGAVDESCTIGPMGHCVDTFITRLSPDGSGLLFSSYLGGSGDDFAYGIAVDTAGGVYLTGETQSSDFPTANPFQASCVLSTFNECSDAFVMKLTLQTTTDDLSYAVRYDNWRGVEDAQAAGPGYRAAANSGHTITYKTPSAVTAITLITYRGPDQGKAQVSIDGVDKGTLDLYAATPQYQYLKTYSGLSSSIHTIEIKVLGTKNAASSGTEVRVDGFKFGDTSIADRAPEVRYSGWSGNRIADALGGSYRYASKQGASVYFPFMGTQFTWITRRSPDAGQAQVYVDDVLVTTVDLYHPSTEWQYPQVIGGLSYGTHNVRIRVLGSHNPSASASKIIFDGFSVP